MGTVKHRLVLSPASFPEYDAMVASPSSARWERSRHTGNVARQRPCDGFRRPLRRLTQSIIVGHEAVELTSAYAGYRQFLRRRIRANVSTAIVGTGGLAIDADGTHRVWLDYEF